MENEIPSNLESGTGCRTLIRLGLICFGAVVVIVISGTLLFGEKGSYYVFLLTFSVLIIFFIGYYIKTKKGRSNPPTGLK
jgi:hypothetical protein